MKLDILNKAKDVVRPLALKAAPVIGLVKRKSPEILLATGILSIGTGTVLACRATLKAKDDVDDAIVKASHQKHEGAEQSEIRKGYLDAGIKVAKKYALPVTLIGTGTACIIVSHNIQSKRILAAVASLDAMQLAFEDYRRNVIADQGPAADKRYFEGVKYEKATFYEEDPETGKKKKVKKEVPVYNNAGSPYAIVFDRYSCPSTWKDGDYRNRDFIERMERIMNQKLQAQGYLWLSDVYEALGHEYLPVGRFCGWALDWMVKEEFLDDEGRWQGDQCVTFFMNEYYSDDELEMAKAEQRDPEPMIVLDFNTDGVIWDKLKTA